MTKVIKMPAYVNPVAIIDSGESEKDFDFNLAKNLALKLDDEYISPAYDPDSINKIEEQIHGTCVEHAGSSIIEELHFLLYGFRIQLANNFNYLNTREEGHWQKEGMIPRQYWESQMKNGTPELKYFDVRSSYLNWKKKNKKASKEAYENAKKYRIKAFFRIDPNDTDAIKRAIVQFGSVFATFQLRTTFNDAKEDGRVPIPQTGDKYWGGHAVKLSGWDKYGCWRAPNSWSEKWGNKGEALIPFEYRAKEIWAVSLVPVDFIVVSRLYGKRESKPLAKWIDQYNSFGIDDSLINELHCALAGTFKNWEEAKKRRDEINGTEGIGLFKASFVVQAITAGTKIEPYSPKPEPQPKPQPKPDINDRVKINDFNLIVKEDDEEKVKEFVAMVNKKYKLQLGAMPIEYKDKYDYFLLYGSKSKDTIAKLLKKIDNEEPLGHRLRRLSSRNIEER